ncbi:energy transducer TonB [Tunturibacter empetritectus]|uniref:TonB family protein n=1 Tax=Tunturiibacter lichenicola TaxID=2051959 RepID=A0A7W8J3X5_9BACT|nr:energy transducer TonB [Edaphobacter lichenicola]MBB5342148.1 TonB family protein [Edaphobacter lichenicola]
MLAMLRSSRARYVVASIFACSLLPSLHAQTTEADIKARLKGKPLYLRGLWREDKLHFDSQGALIGNSSTVTFTVCGFDLKSVKLKSDKLILEGPRVGLELADDKQTRVQLDFPMHIEIAASPSGDYGPALDAVFVDGLDKLVPSMPVYWKSYAEKNFLPPSSAATPTAPSANSDSQSPNTTPRKIAGAISPPKLVSSVMPNYNSVAKDKKYGGSVLMNFWVGSDGKISHLSVRRPLGLGMDEDAMAAVERYVFKPAMENGKPVTVELNIETAFSIH